MFCFERSCFKQCIGSLEPMDIEREEPQTLCFKQCIGSLELNSGLITSLVFFVLNNVLEV